MIPASQLNMSDTDDEPALFPIGTVSEQTGVNSVTLRAWERRYGLITPKRTAKGHRLYSQHDVERVKQVLMLLEKGIPVGRVRDLLDNNNLSPIAYFSPEINTDNPWDHYHQVFRRWIRHVDGRALDQTLNEVLSLYTLETVAEKLLLPLCLQLRAQHTALPATAADYVFFHDFLCIKLGARYLQQNSYASGKRILIANIHGMDAQIKVLLLANTLSQTGYQVIVLSNPVSLNHLPLLLERVSVEALLIPEVQEVPAALPVLVNLTRVCVFLCGSQASPPPATPDGLPIHWLPPDLSAVSGTVQQILTNN
ncbi:MAG: MerR family transcriptional regulator, partial [Thiothrix sp.]